MFDQYICCGTAVAYIADVPTATPIRERRQESRPGLKVQHRHRVGSAVVDRVSELIHFKGRPVVLLDWIDLGGIRTPLYSRHKGPMRVAVYKDLKR
jgi:hypothetical protein